MNRFPAVVALALGLVITMSEQPLSAGQPDTKKSEPTTVPYDSATHGAVQVKGETQDWFRAMQGDKNFGPGNPPLLNGVIELAPGTYDVYVNRTKQTVTIHAGKKTILLTGTLVVQGEGSWYTPYQGKEARVVGVQPAVNSPIALFPGTYSVWVQLGLRSEKLTDNAQVLAGKKTVLKR